MTDVVYPPAKIFAGGEVSETGDRIPIENPADKSILGYLPVADEYHIDKALASAQESFQTWSKMTALQRAAILTSAANLLRDRSKSVAAAITMEQGKPLNEAIAEVNIAADILEWQSQEGRRLYGRIVPSRLPGVRQNVYREALGVVGLFSPWNFPIQLLMQKVAASLSAGCTLVAKAAEETPAAAIAIGDALQDAGVPDGVFNLLFGNPELISRKIVESPFVRKVSLTGSTRVGRIIGRMAGENLKKVTLELGGHAPVLITRDANIEKAADLLVAHKYRNAGQVCVSPTRFFLEDPIAQEFSDLFLAGMQKIRVGSGLNSEVDMGPLAHARQAERITQVVEDARQKGASIETGQSSNLGGYFHAPTVLLDAPMDSMAMNEEPFGPVAVFHPVPDLDTALQKANSLPFALGAYAFTSSHDSARKISETVEAGMIAINHTVISTPETPFGGFKDSGFGSEGGIEAIVDYTRPKHVSDALAWS